MRYADLACAFETKSLTSDNVATFSGIASTSDLDQHNDVIEAGAFEPIPLNKEGDPDVRMLRDHDRSQVIGGWKSFKQQGRRLTVEGELCLEDNPKARETYALMKRGYLSGLSVGYSADQKGVAWDDKTGKRTIKRALLREISIVAFPANTHAKITAVKSRELLYDLLAEAGFADSDIELVMTKGGDALIEARRRPLLITGIDKEDDPPTDQGEDLPDDMIEGKDAQKPYGDVDYADPGYQEDGKKRYPIDTEGHIRAAWNYINKPANAGKYTSDQVSKIKGRIVAAWKRKIDSAGPPSSKSDDDDENVTALAAEVRCLMRTLQERAHL